MNCWGGRLLHGENSQLLMVELNENSWYFSINIKGESLMFGSEWGGMKAQENDAVKISHLESLLECGTEFSVEIRIDDGIESWVEVTDPEDDTHNYPWNGAVMPTEYMNDVPQEEREPTCKKGAHYNAQRSGSFPFSSHLWTGYWLYWLNVLLSWYSNTIDLKMLIQQ